MVVWGWQCRYYVEAQLAQGTAENHSERCIFQHPLQAVYRQRYLRDMKRTRPVVFIDAVGKNSTWVQDVATQGYESFPELAVYIRKNYAYLGRIDDTRLFIRKDRLLSKTQLIRFDLQHVREGGSIEHSQVGIPPFGQNGTQRTRFFVGTIVTFSVKKERYAEGRRDGAVDDPEYLGKFDLIRWNTQKVPPSFAFLTLQDPIIP